VPQPDDPVLYFLDLGHTELRKAAKAVSLVKLQSLLDLALGADARGEDMAFREDVHLMMATSGLCEWLLRIANSVSLVMVGVSFKYQPARGISLSYRCSPARLSSYRQVSAFIRHPVQDHFSTTNSFSTSFYTSNT
jgi:hypothetical protein